MLTDQSISKSDRIENFTFRSINSQSTITVGDITLSVDTGKAKVLGKQLHLRPMEFRLLHFFMNNAELVQTRKDLLKQVWEKEELVGERTIDVHIRRLRASLEPFGLDRLIETVYTRGYRFSGGQQ